MPLGDFFERAPSVAHCSRPPRTNPGLISVARGLVRARSLGSSEPSVSPNSFRRFPSGSSQRNRSSACHSFRVVRVFRGSTLRPPRFGDRKSGVGAPHTASQNANGVPSFSPRLERSDYLGGIVQKTPNPHGVGSNRRATVMQPRWGWGPLDLFPRVARSSLLG